jgi:hypothetical protein
MGYGKWAASDYVNYSAAASGMSRNLLYSRTDKDSVTKSGQKVNIDEIKFRESRDSEEHPVSTPIMIGLDVTGSMGIIPERLTKEGLGILVNDILQKKVVTDPHLLFMGIGDATARDRAPLQVTQFESDNKICDQLTDIWLEGGGGGNSFESYDLAWAFAIYKTVTDAWEKRQEKGFLFTIGDEMFPQYTDENYFKTMFTKDISQSPSPLSLLEEASKKWNIFHIVIMQGDYASRSPQATVNSWKDQLKKRVLVLTDYKYLPQLIISAIALETGEVFDTVMGWWENDCVTVLEKAFVQ